MSNNIPIYNTLFTTSSDIDLSLDNKQDFINNIKKLDIQGYKIVYVLIMTYHMNNTIDNLTSYNFPFDGYYIKEELRFDLEKLPFKLKQMLYTFVIKYFNQL